MNREPCCSSGLGFQADRPLLWDRGQASTLCSAPSMAPVQPLCQNKSLGTNAIGPDKSLLVLMPRTQGGTPCQCLAKLAFSQELPESSKALVSGALRGPTLASAPARLALWQGLPQSSMTLVSGDLGGLERGPAPILYNANTGTCPPGAGILAWGSLHPVRHWPVEI